MTNMKVLEKSRKKNVPGDIFALQMLNDERFIWGRLIKTDAKIGRMQGVYLVYIYNAFSLSEQEIPVLDKDNLLIPPQLINRKPWLEGCFKTVERCPLENNDVLNIHCFYSYTFHKYYDEDENVLEKKIDPCGIYGLGNHRTVDDDISEALGIPLAPD